MWLPSTLHMENIGGYPDLTIRWNEAAILGKIKTDSKLEPNSNHCNLVSPSISYEWTFYVFLLPIVLTKWKTELSHQGINVNEQSAR